MEVLKQFLDAGGIAIIGVVVGACLTYLFALLTRRHQEAREDRTRWYEARLKAYAEFLGLMQAGRRAMHIQRGDLEQLNEQLRNLKGFKEQLDAAAGAVRLVASRDVVRETGNVALVWAARADELATMAAEMAAMDDPALATALVTNRKFPDDDRFVSAIVEFERAARKDLGVPS
jgi:hypothetical protein